MQMWPRAPARGAYSADVLPLSNALALAHGDAVHMRIERAFAIAMLDFHHIAITALHACKIHHTIAHRANRRACWRGVIHAVVHAELPRNRMHAATEAAGHAGEFEWRCEEGLAKAVAVKRVVLALIRRVGCILFLKPNSRIHLAIVHKIC